MAQLFVASTFFGAMSLAAALDAGQFGAADQRRILVVSNNALVPEVVPPLDAAPGFDVLRSRFGEWCPGTSCCGRSTRPHGSRDSRSGRF